MVEDDNMLIEHKQSMIESASDLVGNERHLIEHKAI